MERDGERERGSGISDRGLDVGPSLGHSSSRAFKTTNVMMGSALKAKCVVFVVASISRNGI